MNQLWLNYALYSASILGILTLLVVVLANNLRSPVNRVFGAWALVIAAYLTFSLFGAVTTNVHEIFLWSRLSSSVASLLPGLLLWLVWIFPVRRRVPWYGFLLGLPSVILMLLAFTSANFGPYTVTSTGITIQPGPVSIALQIFALVYTTATIAYLFRKIHSVEAQYKNQIRYMVYGISFTFLANVVVNFTLISQSLSRYANIVGVPSFLVMVGAIGYAMIRHHLFDIRPLVARSIVYILLLGSLAAIYGLTIFGISNLAFRGNLSSITQQTVYTIVAVLLAFTFQPLKRFFTHFTDRIFYRDGYDTDEILHQLGETLTSEIVLPRLLKKSLYQICRSLRLSSGQFVILHSGRVFQLASYGNPSTKPLTIEELRAFNEPVISVDLLEDERRRQLMTQRGMRVSVLLRTKEQFIGFLLLGDKLSGDIYSNQDLSFLQLLSSQVAVAIANAISYEQVSRFNETLKDRVNRATGRLRIANRHLKELDEAKDEFISMASHQLRTPLTTIKGYISMMLDGTAEPLQPKQRQFAEMAAAGTERMVYVISDLLNVSRLEAGRFIIEPEPTDLGELVKEEVQLLRQHAINKGLELKLVIPSNLPKIELDPGKTRQVLVNFIDNATYYTKTGSITVEISGNKDGQRLTVTDTGIGVPPAARSELFTKFFRADNAKIVRPDGTGLGLFLAKKVVEAQDGKIVFASVEGKGSTFGFELPLKQTKVHTTVKPTKAKRHVPVRTTT